MLPMRARPDILCFHCGKPVGDPPILNEVAEDQVCPVCRDRVLDAAPSLLPSEAVPEAAGSWVPDPAGDADEDPYEDPYDDPGRV